MEVVLIAPACQGFARTMNDLLSGTHLLADKRTAGRPQDQTDVVFLEELQRLGKLPCGLIWLGGQNEVSSLVGRSFFREVAA